MELERAKRIAEDVVIRLSPYCQRKPEVVGSIRRRKPFVQDIDMVLIAEDRDAVDRTLMQLGKVKKSGPKVARVEMESIGLDVYYSTPDTWATLLLIRTGSEENNIRLATLAKKKGWRLAASGDGLFNERGERIAGDTEESIYEELEEPWQEPWERR